MFCTEVGKRGKEGGEEVMQIRYTHVNICKMVPVETLPGMGREDEREKWRG
jgi:hypothetical protein